MRKERNDGMKRRMKERKNERMNDTHLGFLLLDYVTWRSKVIAFIRIKSMIKEFTEFIIVLSQT